MVTLVRFKLYSIYKHAFFGTILLILGLGLCISATAQINDSLQKSSTNKGYMIPKGDSLINELRTNLFALDSAKQVGIGFTDSIAQKESASKGLNQKTIKTASGITIVRGKVTDATSGEALPYVNVYFPKTKMGVVTDFEGFYSLKSSDPDDSLSARVVSYKLKSKAIIKGSSQVVNFQLFPSALELKTITIKPGENPAYRILRKIWANKDKNNKTSLEAYQYQAYTKVELDADNLSSKFLNSAVMRPFKSVFDSLKLASGDDGKPILPVFISETISNLYYKKAPERKAEVILANNSKGIGVNDVGFISQLMGATFLDYNFYQNYMNILEKNFVSPISRDGIPFYKYTLADSLYDADGHYTYKIEFHPRRKLDLAFSGTMYIQDTIFALKRISVEVGKDANINFVERIKIQQELEPTKAGPWIPNKLRILLDIGELSNNSTGFLAKMYATYKDIEVNKILDKKVYEDKITVAEESQNRDAKYWENNRHETLTKDDKAVYGLIDSVKNIPKVKSYISIIDFILNGHLKVGKYLEIGPYIYTYGTNIVEGNRFRFGMRTSDAFSKYWMAKGYMAYGTRDNRFKYSAQIERFINRKNWTKVGFQYKQDVEGLGVQDEFFNDNTLLNASSQLGILTRMNKVETYRIWLESDLAHGLNGRMYMVNKHVAPVGGNGFKFSYYPDPFHDTFKSRSSFITSEVTFEARFAPKDVVIVKGNRRVRLAAERSPIFTPSYTFGLKNLLYSDFNYHKLSLNIQQQLKLGWIGRGSYSITGTRLFARTYLPYPLLDIQLGNETIIRSDNAFNLMNFFEFVGDRNLTAYYTHHFDGLLLNKVPLLKRLKWRELCGVKTAWVNLSKRQMEYYHQVETIEGNKAPLLFANEHVPYVEVFYGIENIFKILRIDAIHRITYRDRVINGSPVRNFFVKGSLYFAF